MYMAVQIGKKKYYRTMEACRILGISKTTFLRWLKQGDICGTSRRDFRGWRLFTKEEIEEIKEQINHVNEGGILVLTRAANNKNKRNDK
jgi:excisionase family DNA binding protein